MAVLTTQEREEIARTLMRRGGWAGAITKAQVIAAVAGVDDWWETQQAAANTAIPAGPRAIMTTKEKAEMFMRILNACYEVT